MRMMQCQVLGKPQVVLCDGTRPVAWPHDTRPAPADVSELMKWDDHTFRTLAHRATHCQDLGLDLERVDPPIRNPRKILCVGQNYADHAAEMKSAPPSEPVFFSKLVTTLIGHDQTVTLPAQSRQVDYEAELVVVIGRTGHSIPLERAMDYVFGYTCGHDVSARDWQKGKPSGQWLLGKSFDGFAPLGPVLVTKDEVDDPHHLDIRLRLNGVLMQQSNTCHFLFTIPKLIQYVSQVCTLEPGDLIFTGTPAGVGAGRQPPVFLQSGDVTEVEIDGIGVLRTTFR